MRDLRTILRRLRSLFWTALTLISLLAAILVGVGKLMMPYSDRYKPQLEAWLSDEFQQPVRIEGFTGEWKAFGPRISLRQVTFMGAEGQAGEVAVQHAAVDIKPVNALIPGSPLYSFRIIGADLSLERLSGGRWELSGLGVSGRQEESGGSGMGVLSRVGELRLEDSELRFRDQERGLSARFTDVQGRLQLNGDQIAAEIEAGVSDPAQNRVLGEIKATGLLTFGEDQRLAMASWHAKSGELMLAELVRQVPEHPLIPREGWLNAEVWGSWSRGEAQRLRGVIDLRGAQLGGDSEPLLVRHLNSRFNWRFDARRTWRLDFSDFEIDLEDGEWESDRLSIERNVPGNLGLWVSSDYIELAFPLDLTQRIMASYETPWPRNAPRRAAGAVTDFNLVLDGRWKLSRANGAFERTRVWDWDRWPDIGEVDAQVSLAGGNGSVTVKGRAVTVQWPRNFTETLTVDIPPCTLDLTWGSAWRVDARQCAIRSDHIDASGRLRFARNGGRPVVDINTLIERADLAELDPYWPLSLIRPKTREWLSSGVKEGTVQNGRFVLRGDMDDWPFREGGGRFEALIPYQDVALDYQAGWPAATLPRGSVRFEGASLETEADGASIGDVPLERARARIGDFRDAALDLEFASATELPGLLDFLQATPLLANSGLEPEHYAFEGPARIAGNLMLPLRDGAAAFELSGSLELLGNRFVEQRSGFTLDQIRGPVSYRRDGLEGAELLAQYQGHEAALAIEAGWDGQAFFRGNLGATLPIETAIPPALSASEPLLQKLSGATRLDASLTSTGAAGPSSGPATNLVVTSDLSGVTIALPAPFDKAASAAWPTRFEWPMSGPETVSRVRSAGHLAMAFDMADGFSTLRRAAVYLGEGDAALPEAGSLRVSGEVDRLDLDRWVPVLAERFAGQGTGELTLEPVSVGADELVLLNRLFSDVDLEADYADGVLSGSFDSEGLAGEIRYNWSVDGTHSLAAQLDRLALPEALPSADPSETDPARLPEMHIFIESFRYLGLDMGQTRIEAFPRQDGFRFASVEADSPEFNLAARGDWVKDDDGGQRSDFEILMTSESLGSLMHALDVSSVLEGGQTMVQYDAWWPGQPADFALARLNGNMNFSIIDGNIVNADAGAGRMVGLMSISALPRRLALDFRDVFGSGFGFDEAVGTVTLENGTAYTDDVVLTSTAATMEVSGSSNLQEQTFDYILSIRPGVGQALPVLGALAGGPGGAAAGLALQGLFQRSLGDAAEARYAIRGTWSDPQVIRIPMEPETEASTINERPDSDS